jgi:hypothetical protein
MELQLSNLRATAGTHEEEVEYGHVSGKGHGILSHPEGTPRGGSAGSMEGDDAGRSARGLPYEIARNNQLSLTDRLKRPHSPHNLQSLRRCPCRDGLDVKGRGLGALHKHNFSG